MSTETGREKGNNNKGYSLIVSYLDENNFKNFEYVYAKKIDLTVPDDVRDFSIFIKELCRKGNSPRGNHQCRCGFGRADRNIFREVPDPLSLLSYSTQDDFLMF
ncbi:MAG: hypothetical protein PHZ11_08100 [Desulfitobacteriaceae bacterium]|nr:hypothetical protein [Desulfitobacteriaceae bacterium]MDD4346829.1 hypothetical protein [Desulfitobacteriaceae bacterium]MDD4402153.1 hypothetical protein [Desulfitobacteriaceae bacterium]